MAIPPKDFKKQSQKKQIIWFLVVRTLGNFLVLFVVFGVFATFGPALYFEARFQTAKFFHVSYQIAKAAPTSDFGKILDQRHAQNSSASESLFGTILNGQKEQILVPQSVDFSVVIPKIGANEKVYPNVDPNNESEYLNILKKGIAHAKGTAFPGMNGTTYLFAHSTDNFWDVGRYNAVFYLLNKMQIGDDITIFFQGKRYDYTVNDTKIIDPTDTHYIAANLGQGERLILQTCWPPGTSWKRLLVFAVPKGN
jgi:sortase A